MPLSNGLKNFGDFEKVLSTEALLDLHNSSDHTQPHSYYTTYRYIKISLKSHYLIWVNQWVRFEWPTWEFGL